MAPLAEDHCSLITRASQGERQRRGGAQQERGEVQRVEGGAWRRGGVQWEEEAARQGGAGLLGRARASTQLLLLAGGRLQGRRRWWAGPVGWAAS